MEDQEQYLMQDDKERWSAQCLKFFDDCHQGINGCRREDLDFWAKYVNAVLDRVPLAKSGISHFDPDPAREAFLAKLYERVRHELLIRHRISTNVAIFDKVIWALFQVAPMDQIRMWERQLDDMDTLPKFLTDAAEIKRKLSLHFKMFFHTGMTALETEDLLKASGGVKVERKMARYARKRCLRRDASRCVVTGETYPEVCHLFPISGGDSDNMSTVRWALICLYGYVRGKAIAKKLFDLGMISTLANAICMSPSTRGRWQRGEFALKFLGKGQDRKTKKYFMRLGYYWMKMVTPIEAVYRQTAHDLLASMMPVPETTRVMNVRTLHRIVDGDVITIWADTEDELPDVDFVNCQWDFIRMASLCDCSEGAYDGPEPVKDVPKPVKGDMEMDMGDDDEEFEEVDDTDTASDMF